MLAPLLIIAAKRDVNLSRQYNNCEGPSTVRFNPTHWFNSKIAPEYLDHLAACYGEEDKLGLI